MKAFFLLILAISMSAQASFAQGALSCKKVHFFPVVVNSVTYYFAERPLAQIESLRNSEMAFGIVRDSIIRQLNELNLPIQADQVADAILSSQNSQRTALQVIQDFLKPRSPLAGLTPLILIHLESQRTSEMHYQVVVARIVELLKSGGIKNPDEIAAAILDYRNAGKSVLEIVQEMTAKPSKVVSIQSREDLANLILKTERLEIRAMRPDQVDEAHSAWGDPKAAEMSGDHVDRNTAFQLLAMGHTKLADVQDRLEPFLNFGIYLNGKLVGMSQVAAGQESTIFSSGKGKLGEKWASISYHLKPEVWGQGVATEAANRLVRFAFETLKVNGLHAEAIDTNTGSQAVLKKVGFIEFQRYAGLPHGAVHFFMDRNTYAAKSTPLRAASGE